MGVNEGFAIAARSQLANISAFTDTMTNVTTDINVANTALQALVDIGNHGAKRRGNSSPQTLNSAGQTIAPAERASSQLSSMLGILNTQVGRPLSVFRQRDQYAVGRLGRRHPQRHHHPGRIEAGDFRARSRPISAPTASGAS